jgi:dihydroxy-acid dehydratase
MDDLVQHACPGAGACGGMYTANTMSTAIEAMGLCLPGSSSNPAESPAKMRECAKAADAIKICMEKNIRPRDLLTKESFENALVMTMALGLVCCLALGIKSGTNSQCPNLEMNNLLRI